MKSKPQTIYLVTTVCWLICMSTQLFWSLHQRSGEPPTNEVYAQGLSFQVVAFVLTVLPYWLQSLLLVLIVEFAIVGRKKN